MLIVVLGLAAVGAVFLSRAWKAAGDSGGQQPAEHFRIAGNFYYVGANDVTPFLITGPAGHALIDGGCPATPPLILTSIAKLGFDIRYVKMILNSAPHIDHTGGLSALQQSSGAELWASDASANASASGGDDANMSVLPWRVVFWTGIGRYPAAPVDHRFKDGNTIRVGPISLTAHVTGCHTRGCTPWSSEVRYGDRDLDSSAAAVGHPERCR